MAMANTKQFQTRHDEIRFKTGDPSRMLNKFIVRRVFKTWEEEAVDSSTGKKCKITRNDLLFEKGTFIDKEVLCSIQFFIASGDIKEIEVSNQKRLGYPEQNYYMFPYKASVKMGDKKTSYLLYANSIPNALTVLTDYVELNGKGGFTITDIKEMDFCMVLLDTLKSANDRKYELDIAYLNNEISMDEFVEGTLDGIAGGNKDAAPEEDEGTKRYYQIKAHIVRHNDEEEDVESDQSFIVHTYTAARANILIEKYLRDMEEERYQESLKKNPDKPYIKWDINSFIEESKIISIGCFIPQEFSKAYEKTEDNCG